MAELIAVTRVQAGFGPSLRYALARALGVKPCPMKALSHGLIRPSASWQALSDTLKAELDHTLTVVAPNRADDAVKKASSGREPCVLIRDDDGGVSMLADWNDLSAANGKLDVFERILRSKLLMY
jgi:predicted ATP-grasp superfamily ATP-dependent carboligase